MSEAKFVAGRSRRLFRPVVSRGFIISVLLRIIDLGLLLSALWAAAWRLTRDRWGWVALANAWAFWLLGIAVPAGTLRLWRRSRLAAILWGAGGASLLIDHFRHALPAAPDVQGVAWNSVAARRLRIFSLNVQMHNKHAEALAAAIRAADPDVVALQELEPELERRLRALLDYPYAHYNAFPRLGAGLGIFSRLPFRPGEARRHPPYSPHALRVTLELPGGPLDFYTVHLLPTFIGPRLLRMGVTRNFRLREQQVRELLGEIEERGTPAIVVGDGNFSETNEAYRIATARLGDAWVSAGRGAGRTWPAAMADGIAACLPSLLRIDYCFHTAGLRPRWMRVAGEYTGSDHRAIVVEFEEPDAGPGWPATWPETSGAESWKGRNDAGERRL